MMKTIPENTAARVRTAFGVRELPPTRESKGSLRTTHTSPISFQPQDSPALAVLTLP